MHPDLSKYQYPVGEQTLLAYLLHNLEVEDIINRADSHLFYDLTYQKLFEICRDYAELTNGVIKYADIMEELGRLGKNTVEAQAFITQLATCDLSGFPSLSYVFSMLQKHSTRRQTITRLHNALLQAQDEKQLVEAVITDAEEALMNISNRGKEQLEVILPHGILKRRHEGLVERIESQPIYTGWKDFDKHVPGGFVRRKISVIAGRTSMGKSFFKTNLIINMCQQSIGVMSICPEQGFDSEHDRIDAIMTGIHLQTLTRIKDVPSGDMVFKQLKANSEHIAHSWNYTCVPTRKITVAGVGAAIRRAKRAGFKPDIVFVDLFDRLDDVNTLGKGDKRTDIISVKMKQLTAIGVEENVHICVLAQVNRENDKGKDKRPTTSGLKDSSAYENDADLVMLLYREGYYNKEMEDNILDVIVAKQRDGVAGLCYQFGITDKHTLSIAPMGIRMRTTAE